VPKGAATPGSYFGTRRPTFVPAPTLVSTTRPYSSAEDRPQPLVDVRVTARLTGERAAQPLGFMRTPSCSMLIRASAPASSARIVTTEQRDTASRYTGATVAPDEEKASTSVVNTVAASSAPMRFRCSVLRAGPGQPRDELVEVGLADEYGPGSKEPGNHAAVRGSRRRALPRTGQPVQLKGDPRLVQVAQTGKVGLDDLVAAFRAVRRHPRRERVRRGISPSRRIRLRARGCMRLRIHAQGGQECAVSGRGAACIEQVDVSSRPGAEVISGSGSRRLPARRPRGYSPRGRSSFSGR